MEFIEELYRVKRKEVTTNKKKHRARIARDRVCRKRRSYWQPCKTMRLRN